MLLVLPLTFRAVKCFQLSFDFLSKGRISAHAVLQLIVASRGLQKLSIENRVVEVILNLTISLFLCEEWLVFAEVALDLLSSLLLYCSGPSLELLCLHFLSCFHDFDRIRGYVSGLLVQLFPESLSLFQINCWGGWYSLELFNGWKRLNSA